MRHRGSFPLASIPATEVRTLQSSAVDQEYLISVAPPFRYHEHPEKTYPVIYVLDANLYFGLVVEMVRAMNVRVPFCNELPDAIIVGIGYPMNGSLAESHAQVMHLRMRDSVMELRMSYDLSARLRLNDFATAAQALAYSSSIKSPAPLERVIRVAQLTDKGCHTVNSMRKRLPVAGRWMHNDREFDNLD